MAPSLTFAFTLEVDLSPALDFGDTHCGHRRFIPITGGTAQGPKLQATILPGGGDWNALRQDGMGHVFAKYTIQTNDGVFISVTNEGWIRKFEKSSSSTPGESTVDVTEMKQSEWYARTNPRFEVEDGPHGWLNRTLFVGDLHRPTMPNHVTIDVYAVE
ncbi:hypothetical protein N7462_001269 [Penicillium macrosclerotiorum]|uniref:uncharacterized protein n=1 Tax=Penicillium macrosclerotiorum TaxID=303699 RepID=UPI002546B7DA|nr:uncharacterized protein N7462_001269 [Penicillium macrosclerotiorum]KAJ5691846.1 hypothetical protein N7462_001269 [Penicillium macrosclerotiorum]